MSTRLLIPLAAALLLNACHHAGRGPIALLHPDTTLLVAFYNTENLFDPTDDPARTGDDEFTPEGAMKWNDERLDRKLAQIARAIRLMNNGSGPDLIGLAEVENRRVVTMLAEEHLPRGLYGIVHAESPDERGIDVALLYKPSVLTLKGFTMHRVDLGAGARPTRDVMEATFAKDGHMLTVLVNHWPSRLGGEERTTARREAAARVAAGVIDSLRALDPNTDVVLMGDLNDEPGAPSIENVLDAREYTGGSFSHRMINTAAPVAATDTIGSYFYRGHWEVIDQIMLSRGALDSSGVVLSEMAETVFTPEFLRDDRADPVHRPPYRTYVRGTQYIGGPSDHFPVTLRVGWMRR
ncbi:MAG: endonuclease/exonuclease/phosphatase family protein [Bacteroidetes bacterium]|nr:endonuclease/exonuclease/phosphatase family protein [Bacteroidota bacterium]